MNWFDSESGKSLVDFEQKVIEKYLDQKFGYYSLQLGEHKSNLIKNAKIKHQIIGCGKHKTRSIESKPKGSHSASKPTFFSLPHPII